MNLIFFTISGWDIQRQREDRVENSSSQQLIRNKINLLREPETFNHNALTPSSSLRTDFSLSQRSNHFIIDSFKYIYAYA